MVQADLQIDMGHFLHSFLWDVGEGGTPQKMAFEVGLPKKTKKGGGVE